MNMRGMLPGKRKTGLFLVVLVLLAALGVLFWKAQKTKDIGTRTVSRPILREDQLQQLNRDSDNDGLKEWEEAIYRTDPQKKDSDGDGTDDGMEVAQGRDPLVPGPNDKIETAGEFALGTVPPEYFLPDNLVGQLSEKLGASVVVPRLSGSSRPLDLEKIGNQIVSETIPDNSRRNYFSEKDIKVSNDNSKKAFESYGISMIEAATVFNGITQSPLEIFADALARDNFSQLNVLDPYLAAYDKKIEQLKNISTPSQLTSFHLRYLNLVASQKGAVQKIRNADKDIVGAIVGAQEFASNFQQFQSLMQGLSYVPTQ